MNKNDQAWTLLFEEHDILSEIDSKGFFDITATQINKSGRESRLMTKFDHLANLPELFSKNSLAILPKTRGSYIIGRFEAYQKVKYNPATIIRTASFPNFLQTIDQSNIYSESAALNCAFVSNILSDLVGEQVFPTVSGRMSTSVFDFTINSKDGPFEVNVNKSQCEIDGGYEGETKFLLLEAKNQIVDDFLIRQLYYPLRRWEKEIKKDIIPVFMTYSNDVFTFFIYGLDDIRNYNSFSLIEQRSYSISPNTITLDDIQNILNTVRILDEPDTPFPQADKFERVVDMMSLILGSENESLEQDFATTNFDFDERQTQYYSGAGRYLGLIERTQGKGVIYTVTEKGRKIMTRPFKEKYLSLVEVILSYRAFNSALKKYLEQAEPLTYDQTVQIMKESNVNVNENSSTYPRRAQTVRKWTEWIIDLAE